MRRKPGVLAHALILTGLSVSAQEAATELAAADARVAEIAALEPGVEMTTNSLSATEGASPDGTTLVAAEGVRRQFATNGVMDEIALGRTEITGNQELPKVLYIVPWQKSDPGELTGKPINTLLDEVLAPIDRTEFVRQVEYYGDLYRKTEE